MYLQIAGTGFVVICLIHLLETVHLPLEVLEVEDLVKHQRLDLAIEYNSSDSGSTARENQPSDTINKPRVLYQVGSSESDLPVCVPNAVCSKIDLYETPWIERQCRCPNTINYPSQHISYQHGDLLEKILRKISNNPTIDKKVTREMLRRLGAVYHVDDIVLSGVDEPEHYYYRSKGLAHKQRDFVSHLTATATDLHESKRLRHASHRDFATIGGCSSAIGSDDGHTIVDKTRHYKLCSPIHKLPVCRYFKDYTWTLKSTSGVNSTQQIVHCRCPKNSVTYLIKREPLSQKDGQGYVYFFACSPQSRLRCQRKEPCKLFTVRKRREFLDEVNTNPLCQCPHNHRCPRHHTDVGVIVGKSYAQDNIRTYSGYCMAEDLEK
ncbi:protein giant-lens [Phlebotomus papatasi]|uniref:protein giant-lens n=1 Tax=Phlebotomus papatasi TaxID=29031 RepID=UPI0024836BAE|nr:protein giant-lens [Phlebotomus papatasi]